MAARRCSRGSSIVPALTICFAAICALPLGGAVRSLSANEAYTAPRITPDRALPKVIKGKPRLIVMPRPTYTWTCGDAEVLHSARMLQGEVPVLLRLSDALKREVKELAFCAGSVRTAILTWVDQALMQVASPDDGRFFYLAYLLRVPRECRAVWPSRQPSIDKLLGEFVVGDDTDNNFEAAVQHLTACLPVPIQLLMSLHGCTHGTFRDAFNRVAKYVPEVEERVLKVGDGHMQVLTAFCQPQQPKFCVAIVQSRHAHAAMQASAASQLMVTYNALGCFKIADENEQCRIIRATVTGFCTWNRKNFARICAQWLAEFPLLPDSATPAWLAGFPSVRGAPTPLQREVAAWQLATAPPQRPRPPQAATPPPAAAAPQAAAAPPRAVSVTPSEEALGRCELRTVGAQTALAQAAKNVLGVDTVAQCAHLLAKSFLERADELLVVSMTDPAMLRSNAERTRVFLSEQGFKLEDLGARLSIELPDSWQHEVCMGLLDRRTANWVLQGVAEPTLRDAMRQTIKCLPSYFATLAKTRVTLLLAGSRPFGEREAIVDGAIQVVEMMPEAEDSFVALGLRKDERLLVDGCAASRPKVCLAAIRHALPAKALTLAGGDTQALTTAAERLMQAYSGMDCDGGSSKLCQAVQEAVLGLCVQDGWQVGRLLSECNNWISAFPQDAGVDFKELCQVFTDDADTRETPHTSPTTGGTEAPGIRPLPWFGTPGVVGV